MSEKNISSFIAPAEIYDLSRGKIIILCVFGDHGLWPIVV